MATRINPIPTRAKSFLTSAGAGAIESPTHLRRVALTAANLIAMFTTPVAILPAPGANIAYWVRAIIMKMTRTSTAFTGGGVVSFQFHTTTTSVPHAGTIPVAHITGGAGVAFYAVGPNIGATGLVLPTNEGIDITNATGAFAAGTGTAEVFIEYSVLKMA